MPSTSPLARLRCTVSLNVGDCRGRYVDRSRENGVQTARRNASPHPADPTAIVGKHGPSGLQVCHPHGLLAPVPILVETRHRRPTDAQIGGLDPHPVVDHHVDPGMAQRGSGSVDESGGRHAGVAKRGPTRRSPSAFASWLTSSRAPRPNFSGGAPQVKTVSCRLCCLVIDSSTEGKGRSALSPTRSRVTAGSPSFPTRMVARRQAR